MWQSLIDIFYPNYCYECGNKLTPNQPFICLKCESRLPYFDNSNPNNNSFHDKFFNKLPIYEGFSLFEYHKNSCIQELIHDLKYANQKRIAAYYGRNIGGIIQSRSKIKFDSIIPVPMHPTKLKKRGYNQAELIALAVSEVLGVPLKSKDILKTQQTSTQTNLNRLGRWQNTQHIFEVQSDLSNQKILLIDDVITTGATLEALGKECLKAGCSQVSIATLATA